MYPIRENASIYITIMALLAVLINLAFSASNNSQDQKEKEQFSIIAKGIFYGFLYFALAIIIKFVGEHILPTRVNYELLNQDGPITNEFLIVFATYVWFMIIFLCVFVFVNYGGISIVKLFVLLRRRRKQYNDLLKD
jgi:hypothetical protein